MGMKCESCKIFDAAKGYAVCLNCIPETPKPKTVRVRVAVDQIPDGSWVASGNQYGEFYAMEAGETRTFLTADLPIPEPQEVEAEVEGG